MINNLEGISFDSVVDKNQVTYTSFRKTLLPYYQKVWRDIFIGWVFLILPIMVSPFIPDTIFIIVAIFFPVYFGYVLAYLHLFIHEAAHFNLHPSKGTNENIASWFICPLFAIDLKKYRKIHWAHHLHLAEPEDAEVSYFNALTFSFFMKMVTGVHAWKTVKHRQKNSVKNNNAKKDNGWILPGTIIFHLGIMLACWFAGSWPLVFAWLIGLVIVFPFLATLRQILEHRDELAGKDFRFYSQSRTRISRLFGDDLFSRTFGAAGFNMHMIHHWDPQISYTRLRDVLSFLRESSVTSAYVDNSRTSYKKVFYRLLHGQK